MKRRRWLIFLVLLLLITAVSVFIVDNFVTRATAKHIYSNIEAVPYNKVGLLLGTSKYLSNGYINYYYKFRIDAAVVLYKSGKVDYIIVSGDNSTKGYDEATTMKQDLIAAGIPAERVFMDFAGFRTLDSILRAREIFGQSSITVISQRWHCERAIYIARKHGMAAVGYPAKDVDKQAGFKTLLREKGARVKMMLDLLTGKGPKFYGKPVPIP